MANKLSMKIHGWDFAQWVEEFLKFSPQPMSKAISKNFLNLYLIEQSSPEKQQEFCQDVEQHFADSFAWRVMKSHMARLRLDVTVPVQLMLLDLCKNPGSIVMYLAVLRWTQINQGKIIDIDVLTELFPMGFVSEQALEKMWDAQKIPANVRREQNYTTDNYLDIIA